MIVRRESDGKVVLEIVTDEGLIGKKTMGKDEALRLAGKILDAAINWN